VIIHDNQPKNHYNEIPQDRNKSDEKKREYPVFRPRRKSLCRNFPGRQDNQTSTTPSPHYTGAVLMSRKPTKVERDIPLYLIPDIVKREVSTHGEDLDWVFVRKTGSHFYNIRIRTRPIRRELRSAWNRPGTRQCRQGDAEDTGTDIGTGTHDGSGSKRE
jgi:hypothetical protein